MAASRTSTVARQRALRIELVEAAIADYYASVQLHRTELVALRAFLEEELSACGWMPSTNARAGTAQRKLEAERKALLDAHLAEAVPLDLLKIKQDDITAKLAAIEGRLAEIAADFQQAETNLKRALARVGDCETAYREASDTMRRQFNLAFFERLLIDEDYTGSRCSWLALRRDPRANRPARRHRRGRRGHCGQPSRKPYGNTAPKSSPRTNNARRAVCGRHDSPTTPFEVVGWSQINMVWS